MKLLGLSSPHYNSKSDDNAAAANRKEKTVKNASNADRNRKSHKKSSTRKSTKNDRYKVQRKESPKKETSRSSKTRSKSSGNTADGTATTASASCLLIDRVPTAIGYHSDESEESWLEERSKCSRYNLLAEQDLSDEEIDVRDPVPMDDDDSVDGDDRYSQRKRKPRYKRRPKKKEKAPDTISRLWSESTDSAVRKADAWDGVPTFRKQLELDPTDVSYPEQKGADPIYEVSPRSQRSVVKPKKPLQSPELTRREEVESDNERTHKTTSSKGSKGRLKLASAPMDEVSTTHSGALTPNSDTSSLTDPLDTMLFRHTATEQVVKDIESKLKLLKQVAKKEKEEASRQSKNKHKDKKLRLPFGSKKKKSSSRSRSTSRKTSTSRRSKSVSKAEALSRGPSKHRRRSKSCSDEEESNLNRSKDRCERRHRSPSTESLDRLNTSVKDEKQKRSSPVIASISKREVMCTPSKDLIELNRSVSMSDVKSSTKKSGGRSPRQVLSNLFRKSKTEKDTAADIDDSREAAPSPVWLGKAAKANKSWGTMYSKALFTGESSKVLNTKSTVADEHPKEKVVHDVTETLEKDTSKKSHDTEDNIDSLLSLDESDIHRHTTLLKSTSWFARSKRSDETIVDRKSPFWKKNSRKSASKNKTGDHSMQSRTNGITCDADAAQDVGAVIKLKSPEADANLDEYSFSEAAPDEPALVQCLNFYSCGAVADKVNLAINIGDCSDTPGLANTSESRRLTPNPTIEVMIEKPEQPSVTNPQANTGRPSHSMLPRNVDSFSQADSFKGLSLVPSVVIEVSDMKLHLDGDSERDEVLEEDEYFHKSDVSVTSIRVPKRTPGKRTDNDPNELEIDLDEYVETANEKKTGLRRLWSAFKKKR